MIPSGAVLPQETRDMLVQGRHSCGEDRGAGRPGLEQQHRVLIDEEESLVVEAVRLCRVAVRRHCWGAEELHPVTLEVGTAG